MMALFKQKATAQEVGQLKLEMLVQSQNSKPQKDSELLRDSEVDLNRARREVRYLEVFARHYFLGHLIDDANVSERVLRAYWAHFQTLAKEGSPNSLDDDEMRTCFDVYKRASETPHHLGASWEVGKAYAKLLGYPENLNLTLHGVVSFAGEGVMVKEFLKKVRVV